VWQASTLEMNPTFDPWVLKNEYANNAAAASADYGGKFPTETAA
jgi:hypothetical protein